MSLKFGNVIPFKSSHNVCIRDSQAPTVAPMESLREHRDRIGITQKVLAEKCGCKHSHISHIEHGRAKPSLEVFVRMSEELRVSPKRLLEMLNMIATSVTDIQKERERRGRR